MNSNINLDQIIKKTFPNNYGFLKQKIDLVESKVTAQKDQELQDYFNTNTYNLPLKIHHVKSKSISPFTIPILIDKNLTTPGLHVNKLLLTTPVISKVYNITVPYRLLLQANINAELNEKNKIVFTYNDNFNKLLIHTYQPSSFLKIFQSKNVRLRFAIMLHELGHWVNVREYFINDILYLIKVIGIIFSIVKYKVGVISLGLLVVTMAVSFLIVDFLSNYFSSLNEARADMFAKKLGYGKDLAESLRLLGNKFTNSKLPKVETIKDEMYGFNSRINDILNRLLVGYPSIHNRIRKLMECENNNLLNNNLILEESDNSNIDPSVITKLLLSINDSLYSVGNSLDKKITF